MNNLKLKRINQVRFHLNRFHEIANSDYLSGFLLAWKFKNSTCCHLVL